MGIPSYFSYIIDKYSKIVKQKQNVEKIDNLFMDCNSIVYDILRSIESMTDDFEDILIKSVILKIEDYIQEIKPSKCVIVAFDGVAPFAKMNQQKSRRYKSDLMSKKNIIKKSINWSTSNITPGTNFMNNLSKQIEEYFNIEIAKKHNVKKIIVSSSNEKGEGEHKIFQYLRENKNETENMVLYGLDADLIMLSIFHIEYQKNIYICREAPEFMKRYETNELLFMDVELLCGSINSEMSCKYMNKYRLNDYVFMCFMLGNDFLPHFPALNIRTHGITTLIDLYNNKIGNSVNKCLIKDGIIQWRWVSEFIKELANNEYQYLIEEYGIRDKHDKKYWNNYLNGDRDEEYIYNNIPIIYRIEEKYISPREKYWENRYYKSLFHNINLKNDFKTDICINYLEGLEWVCNYYQGRDISWIWKYNYSYPPLLRDLKNYVPHFDTEFIEKSDFKFNSFLQLAYVLPQSQYHLLPNNVREYIKKNYEYLCNEDFKVKWAFCRYFWESHIEFSDIKINDLIRLDGELSVI